MKYFRILLIFIFFPLTSFADSEIYGTGDYTVIGKTHKFCFTLKSNSREKVCSEPAVHDYQKAGARELRDYFQNFNLKGRSLPKFQDGFNIQAAKREIVKRVVYESGVGCYADNDIEDLKRKIAFIEEQKRSFCVPPSKSSNKGAQ